MLIMTGAMRYVVRCMSHLCVEERCGAAFAPQLSLLGDVERLVRRQPYRTRHVRVERFRVQAEPSRRGVGSATPPTRWPKARRRAPTERAATAPPCPSGEDGGQPGWPMACSSRRKARAWPRGGRATSQATVCQQSSRGTPPPRRATRRLGWPMCFHEV